MATINKLPVFKAVSFGIIAGMRTMYAPAIVTHLYSRHPGKNLADSPLGFMQTITASKVFKVLALAELIGDKMPDTPNRTSVPGLAGRAFSGALVGAAVFKTSGKHPITGGIIGGLSAVASTFGFFFLRQTIGKRSGIRDIYIGAAEDALVIGAGIALTANG